jgi:hypothetical protein
LGVCLAGLLIIALLLPLMVPTGQDAEASSKIRDYFAVAVAGAMTNREILVSCSPRRGETYLLVDGRLSDSEKKLCRELADRIGQTNGNRQVQVFFKE